MSNIEEEKYLTNRAKVERVKAKVKIRFKMGNDGLLGTSAQFATMISTHLAVILLLFSFGPTCGFAVPRLDRIHPTLRPREPAAGSSELSFEYLGLQSVPSDQLCTLSKEVQVSAKATNQVNLVSFANNRISQINSSAFICIATRLKILNLRNNKIELISHDAFNGLKHLQVLLLAGNQIKEVPSVPMNQLAATLRHLDLASNLIEALDGGAPALKLPALISLSLKANPLRRIHRSALAALVQLQTLTLTQTELNATNGAHLAPLDGLAELRYLHLDRLANLSSVDADYCESSRKLASLSLKSNQLAQVPRLANCKALLSIDLSSNRISGTLDGNFSLVSNLIDLYLGFNQLETISADAFLGLERLQVIHLNSNNLKQIHPSAFVPLRATLYELNLAHNPQLTQLVQLKGLDQLTSFKAHGNKQLSKLPYFPRAKLLAFTYAYHCCDYLGTTEGHTWRKSRPHNHTSGTGWGNDYDRDTVEDDVSLMRQLFRLVASRLGRSLWPGSNDVTDSGGGAQNYELQSVTSDESHSTLGPTASIESLTFSSADDGNAQNLSEIVLWPDSEPPSSLGASESSSEGALGARGVESEVGAQGARRRARRSGEENESSPTSKSTAATSTGQHFTRMAHQEHLIDELILQVRQIRFAQSVGRGTYQLDASVRLDDYSLTAADANEHDRLEQQYFLSADSRTQRAPPMDQMANNLDPIEQLADGVAQVLASDFERQIQQPDLDGVRRRRTSELDGQQSELEAYEEKLRVARSHHHPVQCLPQPNAFQPCRDLFDSFWLRASIWLVFLFAFVGNILVIVVLGSVRPSSSASALTSIMLFNAAQSKRHIDVPRFLVLNLAVADILMAIYLGLLAFVDLSTLGEFRTYAIKWQHSTGCQLAGFLAVLSSELSVFILAIITLERNYAITNAVHLNRRLSLQKAMFIMVLGYMYAFTMALLPLNGVNDYRKFSVCLPLDFQAQVSLWNSPANLYLVTLVGINSLSFLLLVGCYLRMYCAIRGSQAWNTNDLKIAKRMSILVLTDFFCWMPIIFVGSLALLGNYLVGSEGLKVLIIFVLPLNSVANPFLYAITTQKFKRDLKVLKKRLRLEQFCELVSLSIGLMTTCKRQKRKSNYAQATVAIRRNQHKQAQRGKVDCRLVRRPDGDKTGRLEIIVTDPQRRRLVSANHAKAAHFFDNNEFMRTPNGRPTRVGTDVRRDESERQHHGPKKGSHLLAKTIRLMRGAELEESVNAGDVFDESRGPNPANTFNPVTMNKTTCFSCHQRLATAGGSLDSRGCSKDTQPEEVEQQFRPSAGPRIVLDSIELRPNEIYDDPRTTPREFIVQQQLHARQIRSQLSSQTSCQSDLNNNRQGSPVSIASAAIAPRAQLRPDSAESRASYHGGSVEQESGFKAAHASSCQTILINEHEARTRIRSPEDANLEPDGRSVSACAFNWPSANIKSSQLANKMNHQLNPNIAPNAQVHSCSCDAIGAKASQKVGAAPSQDKRSVTASSSSQSRSINKLMFGPFFKAWSTLQLSFQPRSTNVTPAIVEQQLQRQRHKECVRERDICGAQQPAANNWHASPSDTSSESGSDTDDQHVIDDILQMSSPLRKRLLNERRMSRSCDLIINYAPSQDGNSTSVATLEPNSSSYDHNDDQRILLATINQLTTRRKKRRHIVAQRLQRPTRVDPVQRRPACTRCRSWSPALLEKLEDCMYQIKSRLPKLGSIEQNSKEEGEREYQAMLQQSPCQSSTTNTSICRVVSDPQKCTPAERLDMSAGMDSSSEEVNLGEIPTDDLEVDDFNETGFVEWTRNMQKKAPINCYSNKRKVARLHQQLSGNSDTLSSHTVGTTLTNLSFDSSTNIPAAIVGLDQQACQEPLTIANKRTDSTG